MKLLFLPLKLTTEALWFFGRIAKKVVRRATGEGGGEPRPAPTPPPRAEQKGWAAPPSGGGAGSAAFAAYRQQQGAAAAPPTADASAGGAAPALEIGARVQLSGGASVGPYVVPEGAVGRIEGREGERLRFLWYTAEGHPVLVRDLPAARLQRA